MISTQKYAKPLLQLRGVKLTVPSSAVPVIPGSCGAHLKHEPVEMSRIEPMHRRPEVELVAQICRNALFPRDADESRIGRRGKSSTNSGTVSGPKYGPRNINRMAR